jgi:histone H4
MHVILINILVGSIIRDTVTYIEHTKRKAVASLDVIYTLKYFGGTLCNVIA